MVCSQNCLSCWPRPFVRPSAYSPWLTRGQHDEILRFMSRRLRFVFRSFWIYVPLLSGLASSPICTPVMRRRENKLRSRREDWGNHTHVRRRWSCHQPIKVIARRLGIEPAWGGFGCAGCNRRRCRFMTLAFASYSKSQLHVSGDRRPSTFLTTSRHADKTRSDSWRSVWCHITPTYDSAVEQGLKLGFEEYRQLRSQAAHPCCCV